MSRREASTPLRLVSTLPLMSNNPAPFPPGFTAPETTGATTLLTSLAESRGSKISSVDWVTAVEELCELMNVTDALRKAISSMAGRVHGPRPKLVALPPWGGTNGEPALELLKQADVLANEVAGALEQIIFALPTDEPSHL